MYMVANSTTGCRFHVKVQFKTSINNVNSERKKPDTAPVVQSLEDFDFRKFNLGQGSATQKMQYL